MWVVYFIVLFFRFFPKIFGENENLPLDKQGTLRAFEELTKEVLSFNISKHYQFNLWCELVITYNIQFPISIAVETISNKR